MRVLIIDDSAVMRMIVERMLRQTSLEVEEVVFAGNGMEGLAALEADAGAGAPIHLVLCDVQMPVMSGLEFLAEKRRRGLSPEVQIVMVTAEGNDAHGVEAIAAGAHGYISKPFTLEQMQQTVAALMQCAA